MENLSRGEPLLGLPCRASSSRSLSRPFRKRFKLLVTSATLAVSLLARGLSSRSPPARKSSRACRSLSKRLDFAAPPPEDGIAIATGLAVADGRPTPTDVLWEIKRATSLVSSPSSQLHVVP